MTLSKMAASMPTNENGAYVEMASNSNFAHQVRLSQVNMLFIIDKYILCEFHLNAVAGQKGEFCDLVTHTYSGGKLPLCKTFLDNTLSIKVT